MARKDYGVTIKFNSNTFDNIFEKERKKVQAKLGKNNLSQVEFTGMIKGFKFKLKSPKQEKKFAPKRFKFYV